MSRILEHAFLHAQLELALRSIGADVLVRTGASRRRQHDQEQKAHGSEQNEDREKVFHDGIPSGRRSENLNFRFVVVEDRFEFATLV